MRILLLSDQIPPENRGGAGLVTWRLALGLRDAGHEVHVIAATHRPSFEEIRENVPTYHIRTRYPERFRAYFSLYNPQTVGHLHRLMRDLAPDVVNAHNIHAHLSYQSLVIANRLDLPAVFTSHDVMPFAYGKIDYIVDPDQPQRIGVASPADYRLPPRHNLQKMRFRYNPVRNLLIRHTLSHHTQARTAPSQALCDAHAANGLPFFQRVHNGLDPIQWQVSGDLVASLRHRLGLQGRRVILFAGRLTNAKGTQPLLWAMRQVVRNVPEAVVLALSPTPITDQIRDPAYADLRDAHFISGGWLEGDELAAAYHLADVVVAPSIIFDTFPTVVLEGMAARKPVIAGCWGGASEAVIDGETGYIINPYDTSRFAQRLTSLLLDPDLAARLGTNGYERLLKRFTLRHYVDAMLDVYQQAIDRFRNKQR